MAGKALSYQEANAISYLSNLFGEDKLSYGATQYFYS